jgi:hypothetical protein
MLLLLLLLVAYVLDHAVQDLLCLLCLAATI